MKFWYVKVVLDFWFKHFLVKVNSKLKSKQNGFVVTLTQKNSNKKFEITFTHRNYVFY
jgi:hypothetical protein